MVAALVGAENGAQRSPARCLFSSLGRQLWGFRAPGGFRGTQFENLWQWTVHEGLVSEDLGSGLCDYWPVTT